jgi:hypothetical protein
MPQSMHLPDEGIFILPDKFQLCMADGWCLAYIYDAKEAHDFHEVSILKYLNFLQESITLVRS